MLRPHTEYTLSTPRRRACPLARRHNNGRLDPFRKTQDVSGSGPFRPLAEERFSGRAARAQDDPRCSGCVSACSSVLGHVRSSVYPRHRASKASCQSQPQNPLPIVIADSAVEIQQQFSGHEMRGGVGRGQNGSVLQHVGWAGFPPLLSSPLGGLGTGRFTASGPLDSAAKAWPYEDTARL